MEFTVTSDEDVNELFRQVAIELHEAFDYSPSDAAALAKEYYVRFTNTEYCRSLGIPVQDDDFFFHESAGGVALRAHYYLGLKGTPGPKEFLDWRTHYYRALRGD